MEIENYSTINGNLESEIYINSKCYCKKPIVDNYFRAMSIWIDNRRLLYVLI